MSAPRDPDQILHAWLEEGPTVLPAPTVRAIEVATRATAQRRPVMRLPWRFDPMPFPSKLLGAAAIVAVLLIGGVVLLSPRGEQPTVGGQPTPSASPSAAPSPSSGAAAPTPIDPATWVPYTSERYGYTLDHPADWTIKPSQVDWEPGTVHSEVSQWPDEISDAQGGFNAPGYTIYGGRQDLETGQTPKSWTAQYIANKELVSGDACSDISTDRYEPVEIDGETGQRVEMVCAGTQFYTAAIVVHDGSAYLVALATLADSGNPRAVELFDAILASFRFAAS